jgi:hypothetical protein
MPFQRFRTAQAFTSSYENIRTTLSVRSGGCKHTIITAAEENTSMNNTQLAAFYEPIRPLLEESAFKIERAIEDDSSDQIVLWCSLEIRFKNKAIEPYWGHYVFLLEFSAD